MDDAFFSRLLDKLDGAHNFPGRYTFKFIVPQAQLKPLQALMPVGEISLRSSASGKYTALTIHTHMQHASDVITVYKKAAEVPGIISL